MAALTDKQFALVEYIDANPGKSKAAIARELNVSRVAVFRMLARARKRRDAEGTTTIRTRRRVVLLGGMAA